MAAAATPLRRLLKRPEFLRVARKGRKWAAPGMVVQVLARPKAMRDGGLRGADGDETAPDIGVGFTASKKVGGAVLRNRAKRRLRALAQEILPFEARPGIDIVLIARQSTPNRPYEKLRQDLRDALTRLKAARNATER